MQLEALATEECQIIAVEVLAHAVLDNHGISKEDKEAEFSKSFATFEVRV